jgi:hypothetical protein
MDHSSSGIDVEITEELRELKQSCGDFRSGIFYGFLFVSYR